MTQIAGLILIPSIDTHVRRGGPTNLSECSPEPRLVLQADCTTCKQPYYVDLPTEECIGNPDGAFKNVAVLDTREAAIAFAQEHFGADEEGRVCLVIG
jgi:hypothetical protein